MASGYETILADVVLARMTAAPNIVRDMKEVRRAHRTLIPKCAKDAYAVHVVDGYDQPQKDGKGNVCSGWREGGFTISLFARDDLGPTVLDPLKVEVVRRLNPYTEPHPVGITIDPLRITIQTQIADGDASRVDLNFEFCYPVQSEWSLELP